jgi:hypothetical protein
MKKYTYILFAFSIVTFAQKQTQYTLVDQQISQIPIRSTYSTDAIADYINAHFQTDDNKIRAVFYWTASNISYDVDKMVALNNKEALENNSTKILKSKKVCYLYQNIRK